jgi:hypothetical protein
MEEYAALSQREQDHWAALLTLQGETGAIDPQRIWRLREATAGARNANTILTAIATQMAGRIDELGVARSTQQMPDIANSALCRGLAGEG